MAKNKNQQIVMKSFKILVSTFLIFLIVCVFCAINVSAVTSVSFRTDDVQADNNRLFYVDVIATSDKPLSAATFEFCYDENLAEFRDVDTDTDSKVVYNDKSDCAKVSYLNAYGKEISDGDVIFTMQFKSLSSGRFNLDYTVSDCVDYDVKQMEIDSVISGEIKINEKSESSFSKGETSKISDSSDVSSTNESYTQSSTKDSHNELGLTSDINERNTDVKFIVAIIIICLVSVFALAVITLVLQRIITGKSLNAHTEDSNPLQNTE